MPGRLSMEELVLLAAAASVQFARGRSSEDIELWAAFFEAVANNLALLGLSAPSDKNSADE